MKFSLAITGLVLLVGAAAGLLHQQKLTELRTERESLVAEAESMGLTIDPADPASVITATRRTREDPDDDVRRLTADIIALIKEMQEAQENGNPQALELRKRMIDLANGLMDLNSSQLKMLISEIRDTEGLHEGMRQELALFAIMILGENNPRSALTLFTESSDLLADSRMSAHVIASALSRWAADDPIGALAWVRENSAKHPDIVTDQTKQGIVAGAAKVDPALAFQLLGELELKQPSAAAAAIVRSARTPEERDAIVKAMRKHLGTMPESDERDSLRQNLLQNMVGTMRADGFETTSAWLERADLSPDEAKDFASGLHYHATRNDSGRWIGWMSENLPPEELGGRVRNIVSEWTRQDYVAAGTWLAQAPDDAAKAPAVRAYAETVAAYEPATAEQWALTLPPGKDRRETLESIHHRWPEADREAKAAFAKRHGLGE